MSAPNRTRRYVLPTVLFLVGGYIAYRLIVLVTEGVGPTQLFQPIMANTSMSEDIVVLLFIGMPVLIIEYLIIAIPGATLILLITRIYKSTSYEMNIMNIGREFDSLRMIKRTVAPALFSLALAGTLKQPISQYIFGLDYADLGPLEAPTVTLMGALLFMFISLALFTPTWVLNDTGVVTHIKGDLMRIRRCPDTQGVGRWMSNVLGGYGVIAYPLFAFTDHFYSPLIVPLIATGDWNIFLYEGLQALLFTLVLPFIMMAFIMPAVITNEMMQGRVRDRVSKVAERFGAKRVRKEVIQVDKRTSAGMSEDEKKPDLDNGTKIEKQVVSSAKTTKRKSSKDNKKKTKTKKK